jgi:hypothetical protein
MNWAGWLLRFASATAKMGGVLPYPKKVAKCDPWTPEATGYIFRPMSQDLTRRLPPDQKLDRILEIVSALQASMGEVQQEVADLKQRTAAVEEKVDARMRDAADLGKCPGQAQRYRSRRKADPARRQGDMAPAASSH